MNEKQIWLERIAGLIGEDAGETPEIIFEAVAKRIDELEEQLYTSVEREQSSILRLDAVETKLDKVKATITKLRNTRSYEQFYIRLIIDELTEALRDEEKDLSYRGMLRSKGLDDEDITDLKREAEANRDDS